MLYLYKDHVSIDCTKMKKMKKMKINYNKTQNKNLKHIKHKQRTKCNKEQNSYEYKIILSLIN